MVIVAAQCGDPTAIAVVSRATSLLGSAIAQLANCVDPALIVNSNFRANGGYEAADQLLTQGTPPTAIFACNDMMAMAQGFLNRGGQLRRYESMGFDHVMVRHITGDHRAIHLRLSCHCDIAGGIEHTVQLNP